MPINGVGGFTQLPVNRAQAGLDNTGLNNDGDNNRSVTNEQSQNTPSLRDNPTTSTQVASTAAATQQVVPANRETIAIQPQDSRRLNPLVISNNQPRQFSTDAQPTAGQAVVEENQTIVITEQQQQLQQRFLQSSLPVDNASRLIDERV